MFHEILWPEKKQISKLIITEFNVKKIIFDFLIIKRLQPKNHSVPVYQ